jgi:hypothetical protein
MWLRAGSGPGSPPGAEGRCGWHRTTRARRRLGAGTLTGKVLLRGCNRSSSPARSKMLASRARPSSRTRRAVTVSSVVGRFRAHTEKIGHNRYGSAALRHGPRHGPFGLT